MLEVFWRCLIQIYEGKNEELNMLFKKYAKMVLATISFISFLSEPLYYVENVL